MLIRKGYRYRIYPGKAQQDLILRTFGCARYVYNYFLTARRKWYREHSKTLSYSMTSSMLTALKKDSDHIWLSEVDSMALQEELRNLDRAYTNFFKHRGAFPKYKSKREVHKSYRTRNQGNGIRFEDGKLRLPVLGFVKIRLSRDPLANGGRILNATVSQTATGKYFVSLCVEEELTFKENAGGLTGIDLGLKDFYTDSNGNRVPNPKTLARYEKKLAREQRSLSRMILANTKGYGSKGRPIYAKDLEECSNIQKQRHRIALIHEKIVNIRTDFMRKAALQLVSENQVIGVESLNIKGMLRNHRLAKAISDVSWGTFVRYLEEKAPEYGCEVRRVSTFYPSSQTCSFCGYKYPKVKDPGVRHWVCPVCGMGHDRDVNAAVNILNRALGEPAT